MYQSLILASLLEIIHLGCYHSPSVFFSGKEMLGNRKEQYHLCCSILLPHDPEEPALCKDHMESGKLCWGQEEEGLFAVFSTLGALVTWISPHKLMLLRERVQVWGV